MKEKNSQNLSLLKKRNDLNLATPLDGVVILDRTANIMLASPIMSLYFQQSLASLQGQNIRTYLNKIDPDLGEIVKSSLHHINLKLHKTVIGFYTLSTRELGDCHLEISLLPLLNNEWQLEGYLLPFLNVAEKKYESTLHSTGIRDELTGVLTQKTFLHRLEHMFAYCHRDHIICAVIYIGIDNFKQINVEHKMYGDELLLKIAMRLQRLIRESDLLARGEGDCFMIAAQVQHPSEAGKIAARLKQSFKHPFELNAQHYQLNVSTGIALAPRNASHAKALIEFALLAMQRVKQQGKDHFQYYQASQATGKESLGGKDVHLAIKHHQLNLYFQPWFHAIKGNLMGLSTLVRWDHPRWGTIAPPIFLSLAQKSCLMSRMQDWVLNDAGECLSLWCCQGLTDFKLSINVEVKKLLQEDFIFELIQTLKYYHLPAQRLQLNLIGSHFNLIAAFVLKKLQQLRQLGFCLAWDDTANGFSCLSIQPLPLDLLQINRIYTQRYGLGKGRSYQIALSAMMKVAKQLKIQILAEGIESQEQASFFRALGCDFLQGSFLAKPMTFQQVTEFMLRRLDVGSIISAKYY